MLEDGKPGPEKRICRYYNTSGGCWYAGKCKFLHIADKKPPCKFHIGSTGCKYGENCHFSHDIEAYKAAGLLQEGYFPDNIIKEDFKENLTPNPIICTNNNSMEVNSNLNNSGQCDSSSATTINRITPIDQDYNGDIKESLKFVNGVDLKNPITTDSDYRCGTCKRPVVATDNESYCNLLKDHYLANFMEKDGEHIKYVKYKAGLDPGQLFNCKSCVFIFEKPWSLFQHMADKARDNKNSRWEKKHHADWLETVAGLMAAHDLGLFTTAKLRSELRNFLLDQQNIDEDMDIFSLLFAASTVMPFMNMLSNTLNRNQMNKPRNGPSPMGGVDVFRQFEAANRQLNRRNRMLQPGGGNGAASGLNSAMSLTNFGSGNLLGNGNAPGGFNPRFNNPFLMGNANNNSLNRMNNNRSNYFANNISFGNSANAYGLNNVNNSQRFSPANNNASYNANIQSSNINSAATITEVNEANLNENQPEDKKQGGLVYSATDDANNKSEKVLTQTVVPDDKALLQSTANINKQQLRSCLKQHNRTNIEAEEAKRDLKEKSNYGFSESEVQLLINHGVQPWEDEAAVTLSALRGDVEEMLAPTKVIQN